MPAASRDHEPARPRQDSPSRRPGGEPGRGVRRQRAGTGSARSWLLTVLGEFALPSGEPAWTAALLHVATGLGIEAKSARQALARLAADGWIAAERSGRRARWALTPQGRDLLAGGAERIYTFGAHARPWDGRWLVLLVSVPESRRQVRRRLRTRLTWAGFGSPVPGVWVSPHPAREAEAKQVIEQLGLAGEAYCFTGPFAGIGAQASLVEQAWHLDDLARRYRDFLAEFAAAEPASGDGTLLAQVRLVHAWRHFPLADPGLPPELLPPGWPGIPAAALFAGLRSRWQGPARARWAQLGT